MFKDDIDKLKKIPHFSHEAMATTFEIYIEIDDLKYAKQAAVEIFQEIDRLEQQLSRYIENSDISQINALNKGQSISVGLETFECLKVSAQLYEKTDGVFDVTAGALKDFWLNKTEAPKKYKKSGFDAIVLNEDLLEVTVLGDNVTVDLGGIGKGFALDKAKLILEQWDLSRSLMHSGYSTILALEAPDKMTGWPLTISDPEGSVKASLYLSNYCLAASGLAKGAHIIDPGEDRPVKKNKAAWSCESSAARADGLSTAFMIMDLEQIEKYCLRHSNTSAFIMTWKAVNAVVEKHVYGNWEHTNLSIID